MSLGQAFFCTAGHGMEPFVMREVSAKLSAEDVESLPGKVFFRGAPDLCALRSVKSAERLFLLLHKGPPLAGSKGNVFQALRNLVHGDRSLWLDTLRVWETFQQQETSPGQEKAWKRKSENDPTEPKPKTCKEETGAEDADPPEQTAPDPATPVLLARAPIGRSADPATPVLPARPPIGCSADPATPVLPARAPTGRSADPVTPLLPAHPPTGRSADLATPVLPARAPIGRSADPATPVLPARPPIGHSADPATPMLPARAPTGRSADPATPVLPARPPIGCSADPATPVLPARPPTGHSADPATPVLPARAPTGRSADPATPVLPARPPTGRSAEPVTFRVSCRCAGVSTRTMSAQDISRIIGVSLSKQFGWKPDLRRPRLEVFVHLNDLYSVVGFPILRQPLANRDYIQRAGLRATTAWAMASVAEISTAKYVLDPMCGVGTILLEAAIEWPLAIFLGIDNSESQLKVAVENVKKAGVAGCVAFLRGSVLALPVLSESMDVVISDIPFGRKFTCSKDMTELLPDLIHQMERVLRVGGVLVLLLSQKLHYHLKTKYKFKSNESENLQNRGSDASSQRGNEDSETGGQSATRHLDFPTLTHVESHPVSLGTTEAVIFKCKKTSRAGVS